MPTRPCLGLPGQPCGRLTTRGDSRCPGCASSRAQARDKQRGSRQQRGYDADYDRARERWAPKVEAGTVHCHAPTCIEHGGRLILPQQAWDLGHDEQRRIRGPEHATCNRSAGGRAAHRG